MLTSLLNAAGFGPGPEPCQVQGKPQITLGSGLKEGSKKNPQPPFRRLGILPACTLHSLILEDF
jgi:hypothetical protein